MDFIRALGLCQVDLYQICVDMISAFKTTKFDDVNDINFGAFDFCPTRMGDKFEY